MSKGFPSNFLWCAATSAYQAEGAAYENGKRASQQDIINKENCIRCDSATADTASNQHHHYKEGVTLMKEMGFTTYRFSTAWSRVLPDGVGEVNEASIQYYRDLIDGLLANDIEPIVILYHYDLPWTLVGKYNEWLSREVVGDFVYFIRYIIDEPKDKVKYWTTINEQSIIVQYWTQKCYTPEELRDNNQLCYQINYHMNLAHVIACKLVHELVSGGLAGTAIGCSPIYLLTSKPGGIMAAQNAHNLRNTFYPDIYFKGFYAKSAMIYLEEHGLTPVIEEGDTELIKEGYSDFLALNYYASKYARACPIEEGREIRYNGVNWSDKKGDMFSFEAHPGFHEMYRNPNLDTAGWDRIIDPTGPEYIFRDVYTRYNKPLMVTENGMGIFNTLTGDGRVHDGYCVKYLCDHIEAMRRAVDYKVGVLVCCPWSTVDLLLTSNDVKKRYGFVYVDRTDDNPKGYARVHRDSFCWYRQVMESNGADS